MMSNVCYKILKYLEMRSWFYKCKGNLVGFQIPFYHSIPDKSFVSYVLKTLTHYNTK